MTKQKKKTISFKIDKIETVSFSVDPSKISPRYNQPMNFEFTLSLKIDIKKKHLIYSLGIRIFPKSSIDIQVGNLDIIVQFSIKNMDDFIEEENVSITLPDILMINLITLVISTARGIWAEKVSGTKIQKIILPLMNPQKILADMASGQKKIESN